MSEKMIHLNGEVIKGPLKKLVHGSVVETLSERLEAESKISSSVKKLSFRKSAAWQKKLCKRRQATVKGTGANRGSACAGHRLS